jgi:rhamnogalacturonan II specific xylosyltransferase
VIDFTAFSVLQGLFNLTSCRPHLLAILQLGYAVLYNDVDLVWLADPFPLFEGHHDIFLSDDLAEVFLGLTFACCSGQ